MSDIERIKKQGAMEALQRRITSLTNDIERAFHGGLYGGNGKFLLQAKLDGIETCVKNIRETLAALNEMEPGHK